MAFMCPALSNWPCTTTAFLTAFPAAAGFQNSRSFLHSKCPPETQTHVRAKTRSKKISEQQWNYHESLPSSMSWVPTSLNLRVSFHDHTLSLESLQISVLSRTYCACWKCGMISVAGAVTHIVEWWNARHGWDKE